MEWTLVSLGQIIKERPDVRFMVPFSDEVLFFTPDTCRKVIHILDQIYFTQFQIMFSKANYKTKCTSLVQNHLVKGFFHE